jgi:hypothetical protein
MGSADCRPVIGSLDADWILTDCATGVPGPGRKMAELSPNCSFEGLGWDPGDRDCEMLCCGEEGFEELWPALPPPAACCEETGSSSLRPP